MISDQTALKSASFDVDSMKSCDSLAWIDGLKYDDRGLIPCIVQAESSGEVLMMAWMNAESLRFTLRDRSLWFWSRSRQELWHKGSTSGNYLDLKTLTADCDRDTLLATVDARGPACHTGRRSCFFEPLFP